MSKKNNIEELFKDSMEDFRVDPPKETTKKILLGLFWSNLLYKYKGAMIAFVAVVLAGTGVLFFVETKEDQKAVASKKVVETENKSNLVISNSGNENKEEVEAVKKSLTPSNTTTEQKENVNQPIPSNNIVLIKESKINTNHSTLDKETVFSKKADIQKKKNVQKNIVPHSKLSKSEAEPVLLFNEVIGEENSVVNELNNDVEKKSTYESKNQIGSENTFVVEPTNAEKNTNSSQVVTVSDSAKSIEVEMDNLIITADSAAKSVVDSLKMAEELTPPTNKKVALSYFIGAGVTDVFWLAKYNDNTLNPSIQATVLGGVQLHNFKLAVGAGYQKQVISQSDRNYTLTDSVPVLLQTTITYDTVSKTFDTSNVYANTAVSTEHTRLGSSIQLQYFSVPLQLSYGYRLKNHELAMKVGLGFHFLTSSTISTPTQENSTDSSWVSILGNQELLPNKFYLDYSLYLNYGYHFNSKWMIMAGVFTRQNLKNPLIDNSTPKNTQAQPRGWGGELQLIYKF